MEKAIIATMVDTLDTSKVSLVTIISIALLLATRVVYNVYFHPLKDIPGPWLYATSRLPYIANVLTGRLAVRLHELHEKYGPVVRTASNEISFIGAEAWDVIYSRKNTHHIEFPKNYDQWNETTNEFNHTIFLATKSDHSRMRKILSQAFSDKMLRNHASQLQKSISVFLNSIQDMSRNEAGQLFQNSVDFNEWFNLLAFDTASEFVLGESFHTLTQPEHRAWLHNLSNTWLFISIASCFKSLGNAQVAVSLLLPKKWLQSYVDQLTLVRNKATKMLDVQSVNKTLMSTARRAPKERPEGTSQHLYLTDQELLANAELVVTAGTDTSATVLPATLYLLARTPAAMQKVTDEIRTFKSEADIDLLSLDRMPYLTACITEALRTHSPVPEGLPRLVPGVGENICGYWIPGGTFCQISTFAANRSSAHFTSPDTFIPERWLQGESNAAMRVKYAGDKRSSFRPFSAGPRDCMGQVFAMATMRLTLARLLYRFDIECATGDEWLDQRCYLLWRRRPLLMNLKPAITPPRPCSQVEFANQS